MVYKLLQRIEWLLEDELHFQLEKVFGVSFVIGNQPLDKLF
jgi:hypothetical protein